jgi:hypothetical protein
MSVMMSDDIFIGPVLRRAETDLVVVCHATFQPYALSIKSCSATETEILPTDHLVAAKYDLAGP